MHRRSLVLGAMALGIALMAHGCAAARQDPQEVGRLSGPIPSIHFDSVEAALKYNPLLNTLRKALNATDLLDELNDKETVATIIAPTNAAFKVLLKKLDLSEGELLRDERLLTRVLSYHVIPDLALKSDDINDGEIEETLLSGQYLTFNKETYLYFLNKVTIRSADPDARAATVLVGDVEAGMTVIHVVNRVLLPDDEEDDDDDDDDDEPRRHDDDDDDDDEPHRHDDDDDDDEPRQH